MGWLIYLRPLEVEFLVVVCVSQKTKFDAGFHHFSSAIFEVKNPEISYSEPRSATSKNGHIVG